MQFRVLGPLEVVDDRGRPVALGGKKQRAVLACLLLRRGTVVPADTIIDEVWSGRPPAAARSSLQAYVSNLRRSAIEIESRAPGYVLDATDVDADRFEGLAKRGREALDADDAARAAELLTEALGLWRGDSFADLAFEDLVRTEITRLDELRMRTIEDLMDARLATDAHADVLPELESLVAAHPLRERLRGQCMLALARSGRQADALSSYEQVRALLSEQLGVDPSPELREIHGRILRRETPGALPAGVVTFLLTDIEGSTRRWDAEPDEMAEAHRQHDRLVAERARAHRGHRPRDQGEGDSTAIAFERASDAVACALDLQLALLAQTWPTADPLRVRMAVHTGEAELRDGNYFGVAVNRCARIRSIASGGQIVLTGTTADLIADALPDGAELRDLGRVRLKDLTRPEHVVQLVHPALPATLPEVSSGSHNLPVLLTSFVGREGHIDEVRSLLRANRLVTLVGPGGTGKTRLAIEAASGLLDLHPDGAWLVELAPLEDERLVPQALAGVLGVHDQPGQPLRDTLIDALRVRDVLVVLDNCEHLIDACARLTEDLLHSCPSLRVLATSREPLQVAGESTYAVPPLPVPDASEAVACCASVRLFCDRAQATKPGFELTEANTLAVADICRRLDGIPLAIELAAARVKVLAPQQIAERLDDRFRLLSGGSRTALPRQRTLQALIDWSYDLLNTEERRLFERLSVLQGPFTLASAEALWDEAALDVLTALVDKSLVAAEGEDVRYRMLETVRGYASAKLESSGDAGAVRLRNLSRLLALLEHADVDGPRHREWLATFRGENDNIRSALSWSLEGDAPALGARLCVAARPYWLWQGAWDEGRRWLDAALAHTLEPDVRCDVLLAAGELARLQGDREAAVAHVASSTEIRRTTGDAAGLAGCLRAFGDTLLNADEYPRARACYDESVALSEWSGDPEGTARSVGRRGSLSAFEGRYDEARADIERAVELAVSGGTIAKSLFRLGDMERSRGCYADARRLLEESLRVHREHGLDHECRWVLPTLGSVAWMAGDHDAAERAFVEALDLGEELGNPHTIASALRGLGRLAQHRGDHRSAESYYREELRIMRDMGYRRGMIDALLSIVRLARSRGDEDLASQTLTDALTLLREAGERFFSTRVLEELACIAATRYRFEHAALLFGVVEQQRSELGIVTPDESIRPPGLDDAHRALRDGLSRADLEAWTARGRAMSIDEAVDTALGREPVHTSS